MSTLEGRSQIQITTKTDSRNNQLQEAAGEIFHSLDEAKIVVEGWRRHYNAIRRHSSLGYQAPAPEVTLWPPSQSPTSFAGHPTRSARPIIH